MNESSMFFFLRLVTLLLVAIFQYAVWRRVRGNVIRYGRRVYRTAAVVFILMAFSSVYIAIADMLPSLPWVVHGLTWTFIAWNAVLILVFFFSFFLSGRNFNTHKATDVAQSQFTEGRREVLRGGVAAFTILAFSNPLRNISSSDDYEVVNKAVRIRNLPDKLKGFRIAMVSDIHSGPFMSKEELNTYVRRINSLKPDIILLPGDFVQNRNEEIEAVCDTFRYLSAPFGVYGSTGNHDYFADADYISRELELAGITMLRNQHRVLEPAGEKLALIGIDDVRPGYPFNSLFQTASQGLDPSIPNILLCHKPYYLEDAADLGLDLMLSGHTHGGQIVLARVFGTVITPAALVSGYIEGLYRLDATRMYITRGIGMVGLPIRINCPPEITVLKLV